MLLFLQEENGTSCVAVVTHTPLVDEDTESQETGEESSSCTTAPRYLVPCWDRGSESSES